jgi:hypothetical protein
VKRWSWKWVSCAMVCAFATADVAAAASNGSAGGAFPDTLLARVGAHRQVSISTFRHAWSQVAPPQRPDSLTPQSARKFLDLLIGKEVLGEAALAVQWTWTARESAEYLGLADRLVMRAMLDSALQATYVKHLAAGDTLHDTQTLGTAARDGTFGGSSVTFDTTLTRRLAAVWAALPHPSRDSSLMSQLRVLGTMPAVAPADTGRVLARSADGDLRVSELLLAWSRLNPVQRPRASTPEHIEELAKNALFERLLRRQAAERHVQEWPDIAARLGSEREFTCVSHLVERDVYSTLVADSLTLHNYYAAHVDDFALPTRLGIIRLDLRDRSGATKMALQLRSSAGADSLLALGKRSGINYRSELGRDADSTLFDRAMASGPGSVLGPDSTDGAWSVIRVMEIIPARPRSFEESVPLAEHAWYGEEGERRMVALIARLRKGTRVSVNEAGLKRLAREGAAPPPH